MNVQGLPTIRSYGDYASSNYGAHALEVTIGTLTVYFSYKTPVAFDTPQEGTVCRENSWGVTTGKHLNWIQPDKKARVKSSDFELQFKKVLTRYGLLAGTDYATV
jgi:hypothetical protein